MFADYYKSDAEGVIPFTEVETSSSFPSPLAPGWDLLCLPLKCLLNAPLGEDAFPGDSVLWDAFTAKDLGWETTGLLHPLDFADEQLLSTEDKQHIQGHPMSKPEQRAALRPDPTP